MDLVRGTGLGWRLPAKFQGLGSMVPADTGYLMQARWRHGVELVCERSINGGVIQERQDLVGPRPT